MIKPLTLLFSLLLVSPSWTPKDYTISFATKNAKGSIGGLKGTIDFDPGQPELAKFDVTVDLNTLDMGIGLKTKHAKQEDFFNAEKYPSIHFQSERIQKTGNTYLAEGKLTIKDITKNVSIPFTFSGTENDGLFHGKFSVNRSDFKLEKKNVGEKVDVEINLPVIK
ncbi:YceI family protein [Leadbetterella byssophila]|jgi:polyisoprenoid-binding protein YceI|uniref:YceI family protein n=1 Tax=Leadbetterella byssophila (strain DSM 17132 / JCM 16389 / KACC 11308 / NBRC 106382 / 4M15) TaxID=649349 RepID=E4RZ38_LEAB4|nr:YceI family protein [Leadbetterella byssophila]ADQ19156.1 YceI family protein [Leadbetterella byssophila DSM 17132]